MITSYTDLSPTRHETQEKREATVFTVESQHLAMPGPWKVLGGSQTLLPALPPDPIRHSLPVLFPRHEAHVSFDSTTSTQLPSPVYLYFLPLTSLLPIRYQLPLEFVRQQVGYSSKNMGFGVQQSWVLIPVLPIR